MIRRYGTNLEFETWSHKVWLGAYRELENDKKVTGIRVHPARVVEYEQEFGHLIRCGWANRGEMNGRKLIADNRLGYNDFQIDTAPGPDYAWERHREWIREEQFYGRGPYMTF